MSLIKSVGIFNFILLYRKHTVSEAFFLFSLKKAGFFSIFFDFFQKKA